MVEQLVEFELKTNFKILGKNLGQAQSSFHFYWGPAWAIHKLTSKPGGSNSIKKTSFFSIKNLF